MGTELQLQMKDADGKTRLIGLHTFYRLDGIEKCMDETKFLLNQ